MTHYHPLRRILRLGSRGAQSFDSRRWTGVAPYTLALASLILIGWAAWRLMQHHDVGASWSLLTGVVDRVPLGPADGQLRLGDHILSIDGLPAGQAMFFPGKHPGDTISFLIERAGETRPVVVRLAHPSLAEILLRLEPLLIGLIFWGLGIIVLAFSPSKSHGLLFFLFCQASSAALASGAVATIGYLWASRLFGILLWWLGPVAIHFHLYFPVPIPRRFLHRVAAISIYALAAVGSVLDLAAEPLGLHSNLAALYTARRFWLAGSMLIVVLLLAWAYRRAASPEMQWQVGLVTLGGSIALVPFLIFSLLPDALLHFTFLPYEVSFLFLLAIPFAYDYAILRYRLMHLDRYASHGAASALVVTLLGGLYLALNAALARLLPSHLWQSPMVNLVLVLLLAAAFTPLRRRLRIIVNRFFYGGWYDYRTAVQQVSQGLDRAEDSFALAQALSRAIQTAMQLECACLLLPDRTEDMTTAGLACSSCSVHRTDALHLEMHGPIGRYFQGRTEAIGAPILREALERERLSEAEAQLLACKRARLWIPLRGRNHSLGLLILGAKRGGEMFDPDDRIILDVIAREASLALQNTQLIAELQRQVREGERLHREIVRAREAERTRVARELHDQIIQALIGLNYHLSELHTRHRADLDGAPARLQEDVRRILGDVRRICADLRPPVMDTLGLVPAVRSYLRELESQVSWQVRLQVEGDEEQDLPEDVALCLYRVLQEALFNAQKHAIARQVDVGLRIQPDEVILSVEDDGRGFVVPPRLGLLTNDGHFGLIGLQERLEMVNGTFVITSTPGRGAHLEARVPLT